MRGVLSVTVISAEDLPPMDIGGKADPFVVLYLKKGETKKKTRVTIFPNLRVLYGHVLFRGSHNSVLLQVVTDTLNPIWNQTFDFMVEDALHDLLMVEVWDHDTFGKVCSVSCIFFVHLKSRTPYLDSLWLHDISANLSLCYSLKGCSGFCCLDQIINILV